MAEVTRAGTPWQVSGPRPRPGQVGGMDEISQNLRPNVRLVRGRWLDVAVAVVLIAAAALAVTTGRGTRPAAAPAGRPGPAAAPALVMDSAGRLWITGARLTVVVPGTRTADPVARTPDLITAAADGPAIWVDTGSTLVRLWWPGPNEVRLRQVR